MANNPYLGVQEDQLGKVFKTWGYDSDGIGDTISDFYRARPDLFEGVTDFSPQRIWVSDGSESGGSGYNYMSFGDSANQMLQNYRVERRGAPGKDGRSDVVVDTRTGEIVYGGRAYNYDPAKQNLKDLATFAAPAIIAGTMGAGPFGGLGSLFGGGTTAPGAAVGAGADAGIAAAAEAAASGFTPEALAAWGGSAGVGTGEALLAADLASLSGGAVGGLGSLGAAGGASAASSLNPALIESALGTSGYGASSAGLGGVTAGQTAAAAALNPYLNAIGRLSPELASTIASSTGGITSGIGAVLDSILPGAVLSNVGGADGISGGLLGGLLGSGKGGGSDWLKMLLPALAGYASYKDAKKPQLTGYSGGIKPATATRTVEQGKYGPISRTGFATGGEVGNPRYLNSSQDGMQDGIAAHIDGEQAAALSGGEFVIPADVVSHLGNGNSNAGARQLYSMMERIRAERTGNPKQGKQIQPQRFLPR